jgi:hypothetical protein
MAGAAVSGRRDRAAYRALRGNIGPISALRFDHPAACRNAAATALETISVSYIPSHAMPHAYVHDDEDETERDRPEAGSRPSNALMLGGAALVGYLLYRALR